MPTGPLHDHVVNTIIGDQFDQTITPCRCMIGETHFDGPWPDEVDDDQDEDDPTGEALNEWDAEDIYMSSGMDEDYDFRSKS